MGIVLVEIRELLVESGGSRPLGPAQPRDRSPFGAERGERITPQLELPFLRVAFAQRELAAAHSQRRRQRPFALVAHDRGSGRPATPGPSGVARFGYHESGEDGGSSGVLVVLSGGLAVARHVARTTTSSPVARDGGPSERDRHELVQRLAVPATERERRARAAAARAPRVPANARSTTRPIREPRRRARCIARRRGRAASRCGRAARTGSGAVAPMLTGSPHRVAARRDRAALVTTAVAAAGLARRAAGVVVG